jgi:Na+-transporting NADH:ubiquinone oxidoreductase subunit E
VTLTAAINWPIYHLILVPAGGQLIYYIVFIIVIAASVQLVEMIMERFFPILQASFGIFLPLITVNCTVLAVSLFMILRDYSYIETLVFAFGSAAGWMVAIVIVAAINEKLKLITHFPHIGALISPPIFGWPRLRRRASPWQRTAWLRRQGER